MTRLARLQHAHERLDEPGHDPGVLEESLDHVAAVNRRLGGRRALLLHLPEVLPPDGPATVLDVGTGSADLPRAIVEWGRREGREVSVVAADRHPQILEIARRRTADLPAVRVHRADAFRLPYPDGVFDAALLSLTLHHFGRGDDLRVLRELARVTRRGIVVNELERSWPNYLGARLLAATLWRGNPITRHDGPVSVRRAFTPAELLGLAQRAGLREPRVYRHFFYRVLLVAATPARRAASRTV